MNRVLGICNLHDCPRLGRLTSKRSLGSVTFLGRYGLMDFALSNFSNSGIDKVCILADKYFHTIRNHVKSGNAWINNTKTGFERILYNEKQFSSAKFNTDINNVLYNKGIVDEIDFDYVIIAAPFFLASMDFRPLLKQHIDSGKEISAIYTHINNGDEDYYQCDSLEIKKGVVKNVTINQCNKKEHDISLETFIVNRAAFEKLTALSREVSSLFTFRKMIEYVNSKGMFDVGAIEFKGYVLPILSFETYVRNSLGLLNYSNRSQLFLPDWPIHTVSHNTPPALYGPNADVSHSFIANGCNIQGTVKNSILSRDVTVEEGAVVENCILFTKTKVGKGITVKNVVTDKQAKIINSNEVTGDDGEIMFVDFGEII